MASGSPIPLPPRTPSPPPDNITSSPAGNVSMGYQRQGSLEPAALPSLTDTLPSGSPDASWNSYRRPSLDVPSPFNFKPMTLAKTPVLKSNVGQRRGHKYKHSSVSHQIFLEPPPRAPLALPNSLPIPTFVEYRKSMSRDQKARFWWSLCHMAVAGYTLWSAHGSMAMTGLSHLMLFDSLGAMLCVVVDILGNFEVWKRSSIRHPFGLERAEVVAGFALSVLLFFMGGDLISHTVQHVLGGSHHAHPHNEHERVTPGSIDMTALLSIAATLISAIGLKNHGRIGKAMRVTYIQALPSLLSNPAHFLTLSCSTLLLLLPLISISFYSMLDPVISFTLAFSMCSLGIRLVVNLGSMLLMSYAGPGVSAVMKDIAAHPSVTTVEEARFWQVHYGLCMANLRLRVSGSEEAITLLRERIVNMIKQRLGGEYGTGVQKWEVSLQFNVDST
ncbi:Cation efflux family protein family [Trichophyton interdigitale]|uniref:Zinc transporter n=1 Tax=Trichophyton interdigitale TaxID=101480 RepID=A0A9P5CW40_9EURO|nr:Cation efflux family protein family [Trichophyton interdigitale]KAF3896808.1 Cation efflux family protein family [Trichophyton interdigitale]KAG8210087.1 Cation efflux family protein family [Trichophyton interdigitale]